MFLAILCLICLNCIDFGVIVKVVLCVALFFFFFFLPKRGLLGCLLNFEIGLM